MAVRLMQFKNIGFITVFVFWIHLVLHGATALKCWQCSWDRDREETEKLIHVEADVSKPKPTKELKDDVIENPSVKPFYGKDMWTNSPDKRHLSLHCENCTIDGGVCLQWVFWSSGSENPIQNFTRMCARSSAELGCYTQDMGNKWTKEACLCKEDNCNGQSTVVGSAILCILTLLLIIALPLG